MTDKPEVKWPRQLPIKKVPKGFSIEEQVGYNQACEDCKVAHIAVLERICDEQKIRQIICGNNVPGGYTQEQADLAHAIAEYIRVEVGKQ